MSEQKLTLDRRSMLTGSLAAAMGGLTCTDSASCKRPQKANKLSFNRRFPFGHQM